MDNNQKHDLRLSIKELNMLKNALGFYAAHKKGRPEDSDGNELIIPYEYKEIIDLWSRVTRRC